MLILKDKKNKDYDARWKKKLDDLYKTSSNQHNQKNEKYNEVLFLLNKIDKIEQIERLEITQSIPDIQNKLILEIDKLRINASFKFIEYLLEQNNIDLKQKVKNFAMGIDSISFALLYSGETLFFLEPLEITTFIKQLYKYIDIFKDINESVEEASDLLLQESSLKSLYSSLYMLESTYRHLKNSRATSVKNKQENSWLQEDKIYESLLDNMDEWSQEEWTPEEQEAFSKAMSNL